MLTGSIVALVTPFDQEGAVDYTALQELIEWHIEQGTQGIVLCGSTGEGTSLTLSEKIAIFARGVEVAKKRIPIIAGTGTCATATTVELTQAAKAIGVDGCLVIVPYYTKPSPQGCISHYREVCSVNIPILVYHHPGRTGVKLPIETLQEIVKNPCVSGIKESSGDIEYAVSLSQAVETPLFCGDDNLIVPLMSLDFTGVISVVANLIPQEWQQLTNLLIQRCFTEAHQLYKQYHSLCASLFLESNPQCVKYALSQMGRCLPVLRLPLMEPSAEVRSKIIKVLKNLQMYLHLDTSRIGG
jgi:4-hydroxy-tetrahydrodipicolinate synthase